ncbi:hypothetical protein ISCGN_020960 [Ixodes scapularis]
MQLTLLLMLQVLTVHGSAALFDAGSAEAVLPYLPKPSSTTSPGLHVSASHDGATVIAADNPCPDKPFATDLQIAFKQRDPRDPTLSYIRAGDFGFVGFGAGTLSDMQLTLLLMLQVLTVHGSAALFDAGSAEAVLPYLPKPSSTTSPGLHVSASHDGATVIAADNPCPDKPFATDLQIAFNQRDPRDPTQSYIRAGDFGFVGFGAGTLSDMQLTLLLMLQQRPASFSVCLQRMTSRRLLEQKSCVQLVYRDSASRRGRAGSPGHLRKLREHCQDKDADSNSSTRDAYTPA